MELVSPEAINPEVLARSTGALLKSAGGDLADLFKNLWWSSRGIMEGWGGSAAKLANIMGESDTAAGLRAGRDYETVRQAVRGFNPREQAHVFDILNGDIDPRHPDYSFHPKYAEAAQTIRGIYDKYADDAMDLGLDSYSGLEYRKYFEQARAEGKKYEEATQFAMEKARKSFASRENYMPHYFGVAAISKWMKPGPERDAVLKQIVDRGYAKNPKAAEVVMREMLERPGEFRGGPLQHTRDNLFNTGFDRDLLGVSRRYFMTASRRLEQARRFGNRDEYAMEIINGMADDGLPNPGKKAETVAKIYSAWAGTRDPYLSSLSRVLTPIHGVTLLSTAGIVQPAQMMNTIARIGWTNTIKAMGAVMKDWVRGEGGHEHWAASTGATLDSVAADFQLHSLDDISRIWMRVIGLEQLDRLNRVVAAVGGRFYADALAKDMMKEGVNAGQYRRLFARMGLDADHIFQRGGTLTADELRQAGLHVSRDTQFASSVLDLPPLRNTPQGRFMYLYKSFALQQTAFIQRELQREANEHGNFKPLINYLIAMGIATPTLGAFVRQVKGRNQKPEDAWQAALQLGDDMATVGTFGAFWDSARALGHGPDAMYHWLLGPSMAEAIQTGTVDLPAIAFRGDAKPLMKHMVRRVPLIGQTLYNTWWGQ